MHPHNNSELIPHLFRTEYRRIVAVLSRLFGFEQVEIAEDIASETFLTASQTWGLQGIPQNPTAWLYHVAKNKARNVLQRQAVYQKKVLPGITETYNSELSHPEIDLSPGNIDDSQLQMMFAVCHPSISGEAQVGLALRLLCGFGIEEIADAFLSNKETITKRLFRAKEKLREEKIKIELPAPPELEARLDSVLTTLYLLFNEGYYSVSQNSTLRTELCVEAIRLCYLLVENPYTNKPSANALLSLMCFHASRFEARINENGEHVLYDEQDSSRWNSELIEKGALFLKAATQGERLSKYHIEAMIAYWNTKRADTSEKWERMLDLYNKLLVLEYSPIAALNRTYALSKVKGKERAIEEAEKLQLHNNQFYFTLLGELYTNIDNAVAAQHFNQAYALAKTSNDRAVIQRKLDLLNSSPTK